MMHCFGRALHLQAYMTGDMTAEQVTEEFQNGWVVQ